MITLPCEIWMKTVSCLFDLFSIMKMIKPKPEQLFTAFTLSDREKKPQSTKVKYPVDVLGPRSNP